MPENHQPDNRNAGSSTWAFHPPGSYRFSVRGVPWGFGTISLSRSAGFFDIRKAVLAYGDGSYHVTGLSGDLDFRCIGGALTVFSAPWLEAGWQPFMEVDNCHQVCMIAASDAADQDGARVAELLIRKILALGIGFYQLERGHPLNFGSESRLFQNDGARIYIKEGRGWRVLFSTLGDRFDPQIRTCDLHKESHHQPPLGESEMPKAKYPKIVFKHGLSESSSTRRRSMTVMTPAGNALCAFMAITTGSESPEYKAIEQMAYSVIDAIMRSVPLITRAVLPINKMLQSKTYRARIGRGAVRDLTRLAALAGVLRGNDNHLAVDSTTTGLEVTDEDLIASLKSLVKMLESQQEVSKPEAQCLS